MNIDIKDIIKFIIIFVSCCFSVSVSVRFFITNKKKSNKVNVKNSKNVNIAEGDING